MRIIFSPMDLRCMSINSSCGHIGSAQPASAVNDLYALRCMSAFIRTHLVSASFAVARADLAQSSCFAPELVGSLIGQTNGELFGLLAHKRRERRVRPGTSVNAATKLPCTMNSSGAPLSCSSSKNATPSSLSSG